MKKASSPLVSVVIPCFNHGDYLLEALASVKECPKNLYEIIIVNDGSTDEKTVKILSDLRKEGYRILDQINLGLATARNNGIAAAKGKYILTLDADNKIRPAYLSKALEILEQDREAGIVYGDYKTFGLRSQVIHTQSFDAASLFLRNWVDACCIFRKQVWEDCGGYDPHMPFQGYEDWSFALTALEKGRKFRHIPEVLFDYRVREDSMLQESNKPENREKLLQYLCAKHHALVRSEISRLRSGISSGPFRKFARRIERKLRALRLKISGAFTASDGPLFSVIIPCFNQGQYLREALDSVEQCKEIPFEILIINDGSTEKITLDVFKDLKRKGYRVIDQENQGLPAARNAGIALAKAPYILTLDADDKIRPEFMPRAAAILEIFPKTGIVHGDCERFGLINKRRKSADFEPVRMIEQNYIFSCAAFRKEVWKDCGGYDTALKTGWEDWDFWLTAWEKGWGFYYVPEILFDYRSREGSMADSCNEPEKEKALYRAIYGKHYALIRKELARLMPVKFLPMIAEKTAICIRAMRKLYRKLRARFYRMKRRMRFVGTARFLELKFFNAVIGRKKVGFGPVLEDWRTGGIRRYRIDPLVDEINKKNYGYAADVFVDYEEMAKFDISVIVRGGYNRILHEEKMLEVFKELKGKRKTILDVIDSRWFFETASNAKKAPRNQEVIRLADFVILSNPLQKSGAALFNPHFEMIEHPVIVKKYKTAYQNGKRITVLWEGYFENSLCMSFLHPVIIRLRKKTGLDIRLVYHMNFPDALPASSEGVEYLKWDDRLWEDRLIAADIAVTVKPLEDPYQQSKPSTKVLNFMAAGLPVICTPSAADKEVIRHGETGFFAYSPEEWEFYLEKLAVDAALREKIGGQARAYATREFNVEVITGKYIELFRKCG